jgi:hypothetical protein
MAPAVDTSTEQFVELDERESNGIRVTLVYDRATQTASVLVWDEQTQQSFALEVLERESPSDVFQHPFAYAAFRGLQGSVPERQECVTCG